MNRHGPSVKGNHVFKDANHRLELYDIGKHTHHTNEYLLIYLPENGLVFAGDMAFFPADKPLKKAGRRTRGLYAGIRELGLKPKHIMTSWMVKDQKLMAPMSDLEKMVKMAEQEKK